jgi:PAS domain-containing protein
MDFLFISLAFATAGICIAMGSVSLAVGFAISRKPSYFFFGVMCWAMVGFVFSAPVGFIVGDPDVYSAPIFFKRIFIFLYYTLLPWFIYHYTGKPGKVLPWFISVITVLCYFAMVIRPFSLDPPLWHHGARLMFITNLVYGFSGTRYMYRLEKKLEARWFGIAMAIFGVLVIQSLAAHIHRTLGYDFAFGAQLNFPIHLHSLALTMIVGLLLQREAIKKLMLERVVESQRLRWKSFLENSPLLILEVNRDGEIITANDFAASTLGASSVTQLVGIRTLP